MYPKIRLPAVLKIRIPVDAFLKDEFQRIVLNRNPLRNLLVQYLHIKKESVPD